MVFCDWLLSWSTVFARVIHVVALISTLLLTLNNIPLWGYITSYVSLHQLMEVCNIHNNHKVETTKGPWTDEGMNKRLYMIDYSAIKGNEIVIHATAWMNFGNTMLNEMSDTKGQILYHSTYEVPRIGKFRDRK